MRHLAGRFRSGRPAGGILGKTRHRHTMRGRNADRRAAYRPGHGFESRRGQINVMRLQSWLLPLTMLALGLVASPAWAGAKPAPPRTENVLVVTLDGFRWQEFFGGADETLLNKEF